MRPVHPGEVLAEEFLEPFEMSASRLAQALRVPVNRTRVDIVSSDVEIRQSDYALAALEQFVRNALIHRSYENTNAPVKVNWFIDRVEIISPGGPFGYVTKDNFGQPGLAEYRNPNIAEAMKGLGFVQRFGIGIQTAIAALKKNGNPPPQFDVSDHWVRVVVWR